MGQPTVIDESVAQDAEKTGDPGLLVHVTALKNKSFRPGSGELQAGMCLQQYVRGRSAELALAKASDDYGQRAARSEMLQGFGTCAQMCKIAAEQMPSRYSPMAAKYTPICAAGSSASMEAIETDTLERLVATYRDATSPLGLYLADRDATAALEAIREESHANGHRRKPRRGSGHVAQDPRRGHRIRPSVLRGARSPEQFSTTGNERSAAGGSGRQGQSPRGRAERREASDAGLSQRADNLHLKMAALVAAA